jgi:hypothetical protein
VVSLSHMFDEIQNSGSFYVSTLRSRMMQFNCTKQITKKTRKGHFQVLSIPDKRIIKTQIHRYEKWCGVPRGVFTGNFDSTTNFGLTTRIFFTINFAADVTTSWYDNLESFCPARHPDRCCDE